MKLDDCRKIKKQITIKRNTKKRSSKGHKTTLKSTEMRRKCSKM